MIARIWRSVTPASRADEYLGHLNRTWVPDCKAAEGNRGAFILQRRQGGQVQFLLLSLWESLEALARSAGPDIEKTRRYPEGEDFLLAYESLATHYQVLVAPEHDQPH